eukprot:GEZU01015588.1.p2 GENE.GEZU01015588.1~~GEZU01015588.1.p2  ORF type:complete len:173 (+),score=46.28 GEZU01015588.1:382-900(+)
MDIGARDLRAEVAYYAKTHWKELKKRREFQRHGLCKKADFFRFANTCRKPREYCSVPFAYIVGEIVNAPVVIYYVNNEGELETEPTYVPSTAADTEPLRLAFVDLCHYMAVVPLPNDDDDDDAAAADEEVHEDKGQEEEKKEDAESQDDDHSDGDAEEEGEEEEDEITDLNR